MVKVKLPQNQNQNKNLNINNVAPETSGQTSHDVRASLIRSIQKEHAATGQMLRCLSEYDSRRLYLGDGFASLYSFLTQGHGYSEGAAMRRIITARFGKRYPEVFVMIDRGDLSLTVTALTAKAFESLKKKNEVHDNFAREIFTKLKHSSKSQAEKILEEKILVGFGAETKPASSREVVRPLQQSNTAPAISSHERSKHEISKLKYQNRTRSY